MPSPPLFGRDPDLAYLTARVSRPGVTAVVARAQMGKSALLSTLADRLSALPPGNLFLPPLVGITESFGQTPDLLLRAVSNLYTCWIASSSFNDQRQVLLSQQNHDLIGRAGELFGGIFKSLAKILPTPAETIGDLVKDGVANLAAANRDLLSGGIQLTRLDIDQAQALLQLVHDITGRPAVLIFDQWEKSPDLTLERSNLDTFLRKLDLWPPCHILLGVRDEPAPVHALESLKIFTAMQVYDLPGMHLETLADTAPLLTYIHTTVPLTATLNDRLVLDLIDGYPGTLSRWSDAAATGTPLTTLAQLTQLADDANHYRFAEFDTLLPALSDKARPLAIRLSLLPATASEDAWKTLRSLALDGLSGAELDALVRSGVLATSRPPSFGHSKRLDAARDWFFANAFEELRELTLALIATLAANIQSTHTDTILYSTSLATLRPLAPRLELTSLASALFEACATLFPLDNIDPLPLVDPDSATDLQQPQAPLFAYGLFNLFNHMPPGSRITDGILSRLRDLAHRFPASLPVQGQFAQALYNTANNTALDLSTRDSLLAELRDLTLAYPGPSGALLAESRAKALFNAFNDTPREDRTRRAALTAEMTTFATTRKDILTAQEALARILSANLVDLPPASPAVDPFLHKVPLLQPIRDLRSAHPASVPIQEALAQALVLTLTAAIHTPYATHEALDPLLAELSTILQAIPSSPVIQHLAALMTNAAHTLSPSSPPTS